MLHALHPDTEAVLLLCGRFGRPRENGVQPLEPREYNRLADWLQTRELSPGDLIQSGDHEFPDSYPPISAARLTELLSRGGSLALAVEGWYSNGLWVLSSSDGAYPRRLKQLGPQAPPLLYGAGKQHLLSSYEPALAIVGSRDVDEFGVAFTRRVARACAEQEVTVISGSARGVDSEAMYAALEAKGRVVGVLADSLKRAAVAGKNRDALLDDRLVLITPFDPNSGFSVGNAMGRNKFIYGLADAGLVVSTGMAEGGTWAGAVEQLKRGSTKVFIRLEEPIPDGNVALLDEGAKPFPPGPWPELRVWLTQLSDTEDNADPELTQARLL
jgi:predicted Rossmann fold nucleotide-binding protein DprA/Smf involved in DNA uptake